MRDGDDAMPFPLTPLAPLEAARQFTTRISKPACLLVAISGGSDSTGLLIALQRVLQQQGRADISLQAVTIDHALRAGSADEARGVARLCGQLGVPHHIRRWDAQKPATGVSAAARLARYALIADVADEIGADMIVVGHTLGDQQETIAMRGARSQRPDNLGLAGMADAVLYGGRHWVMRPFLRTLRQDIRWFLEREGYGWYDDPSNLDARYERVRTRNALEPATGMLIDQSIKRAELSAASAQFIDSHAQCHVDCLVKINPQGLIIEEMPVLRAALSALACVIGGRRFAMAADSMDRVMDFVMSGQPGRMTAGRVVFDRRRQGLYLMREIRNIEPMTIGAATSAVWDERFEITNLADSDLDITALGYGAPGDLLAAFPADIPEGVAKRAVQALPATGPAGHERPLTSADGVVIRHAAAPYDLFLPRFDLPLANAIARVFGRVAYPQPAV